MSFFGYNHLVLIIWALVKTLETSEQAVGWTEAQLVIVGVKAFSSYNSYPSQSLNKDFQKTKSSCISHLYEAHLLYD